MNFNIQVQKYFGVFIIFLLTSFTSVSFKSEQLKYPRVRQAYAEKEESMIASLSAKGIDVKSFKIYLRAFKKEQKIELWAKDNSKVKFQLVKTYDVCQTSGTIGPKRYRGDGQIPEGFYHINRFNPASNFQLSLGINYPNKSDKILGNKTSLGGDIFIHGACVTIGCLPITDVHIKELYIFCVEAYNNGQMKIPITIFPTQLTDKSLGELIKSYDEDDKTDLWTDLKKGYDIFNETKQLPTVGFLKTGRHIVQSEP